jgi:hypothetical protein
LQEHGVPVEIKELLLTTGECAHVDHFCCLNTHPLKRRAIRHWRKKEKVKTIAAAASQKGAAARLATDVWIRKEEKVKWSLRRANIQYARLRNDCC